MESTAPRNTLLLIVDPMETLLDRMKSLQSDAEYELVSVDTAGAALDAVAEQKIAAVVSAFELPDLDGVQLVRSLRISHPTLPYVLAPSDGSESLAGAAIEAGATAYVAADDDPQTLHRRIDDAVRSGPGEAEEHQRYRHLIEMSPAAINVFDSTGESIWCNRATLELLGLDGRHELIGESIFEVIHPDNHDLARQEIEQVIEGKESVGPTEMKLRQSNGEVRYIRVSTATGRFLGEDVGQAIAVDMTTHRERERQFQILDRWLRHNIRNEVSIVQGIADNIQTGLTDDVDESAGRIKAHASRLAKQADQERELIQLLRTADMESTDWDVGELVERQVERVRDRYPDATVTTDYPKDIGARAHPELGRAVLELIDNGVVHNDANAPAVRVEVRRGENRATIRVIDNGPGIPDIERESLLLDEDVDDLHHNGGLGLVLVYWIVRKSNGTLTFDDNDPSGSVVTISLPTPQSAESGPDSNL